MFDAHRTSLYIITQSLSSAFPAATPISAKVLYLVPTWGFEPGAGDADGEWDGSGSFCIFGEAPALCPPLWYEPDETRPPPLPSPCPVLGRLK